MIILRNKLFVENSKINAINAIYGNRDPFGRRTLLEIMKILEMYDFENGKHITHWIDKTVTAIENIVNTKYFTAQSAFSILDWNSNGESVLGSNVIKDLKSKYTTIDNFIEKYVINQLLTERNNGEVKYSSIISKRSDLNYSVKDYVYYYRYSIMYYWSN